MQEIWKDIPGWEGYYQASTRGRVRSLDRKVPWHGTERFQRGSVMVPVNSTDGYDRVKLSRNNESQGYGVHQLVAMTFIPNPEKLPEVNHIDCNRKNNQVDNLEWSTHQDNVLHSAIKGHYKRYGARNPNYGNTTLKQYYAEHPEDKMNLSRPQSQNGRARKIILLDDEHTPIQEFDWMGACAQYLIDSGFTSARIDSIRSNIRNAINHNTAYLKHYYKFA